VNDNVDQGAEWLNLTKAAHRLGWSRERLRSLARRRKVETMRGNSGELLIRMTPELTGLVIPGQAQEVGRPKPMRPAHGSAWEADDADQVAALRDRVGQLEETVAELKDELAEAQVAVARAQGERDVARAVEGELRASLAEARRSWLERLLATIRR
jgi:hypothetical protein